jgi:hypothetical protein
LKDAMPTPLPFDLSRRRLLSSLVGGSLLMPGILGELLSAGEPAAATPVDPLAPRAPHFPARAKRVIFLYMSGGASHVDTFDYKPKLISDAGKKGPNGKFLKRPDFAFSPHGKSGMQISELFPHLGECADDLCMINSLKTDHNNHFEATLGIHTGSVTVARPSIGSWVSYALGTFNQNLPSFVVIAPHLPYAGGQVWSANFLPPCHQGTLITPGAEPIPDLNRRLPSAGLQDLELGMLNDLNRSHLASHDADPALAARIRSFETAAGMQLEAPAAFDLAGESDATLALYGLARGQTTGFGWQCLVARRLAERGVRFIELIDTGAHDNWDSHGNMHDHVRLAKNVDQPIAALLKDLKGRGMLDDTLVVWTTEFGRTPFVEIADNKGREHHAPCFTSWLAGGGAKPGLTYGQSDDYGIEVAGHLVHLHDFHATILHLLGLDHERLTYRYAGRDFRLTDVAGNVIKDLVV